MTEQDLERIARVALRDLGAPDVTISVEPENSLDRWLIRIGGLQHPVSMRIRAGEGTTAQFVRSQIFEQFERR